MMFTLILLIVIDPGWGRCGCCGTLLMWVFLTYYSYMSENCRGFVPMTQCSFCGGSAVFGFLKLLWASLGVVVGFTGRSTGSFCSAVEALR